jgi:hypothetical protein
MGQTDSHPFTDSTAVVRDGEELRRRLRREGYLFIRGLIPRDKVLALRRKMLQMCAEEGWLRDGAELMDGLTDRPPIMEGEPVWRPVYEKLQKCELFHALKLDPNVMSLMKCIFEEPVFALPMSIGRFAFPRDNDRATPAHQDWLYVQGSTEILSCWVPVGDVRREVGGLKILAGSHRAGFIKPRPSKGVGGNVIDHDPSLQWHGGDFHAGDALIFGSLTVHAAAVNHTADRLRLSVDYRYASFRDSISEFWLKPHYHWLGEQFSWDNLDKTWQDASLRRYWKDLPIRTCPHNSSVFARAEQPAPATK